MTIPPWTLPPQFTSVGAAMNRSVTRSAVPASVYSWRVHGLDDLFTDLDPGQGMVALFDLRRP